MSLLILRIALTVGVFAYLSYLDIRYREISQDYFWYFLGGIAAILDIYDLLSKHTSLINLSIGISMGFLMGLMLYYVLGFGGADAIALWVLGVMFPYSTRKPLITGFLLPFPILSIFNNAIILSFSAPIMNLVANLRWYIRKGWIFESYEGSVLRKVLLLFVGRRVTVKNALKSRFMLSMEKIEKEKRTVFLFRHPEIDPLEVDFNDPKSRLPGINEEIGSLWVTVPMPFLVYLFLGIIFTFLFGDIMVGLVTAIMKNILF